MTFAQVSPDATPHPAHAQDAPVGVAPVNHVPLAPMDVYPAGQGRFPGVRMQMGVALGRQTPVPHVSVLGATGQKSTEACQEGRGAVAPIGSQLGHGTAPSHVSICAGWLAASTVAMSDWENHAAAQVLGWAVKCPVVPGKVICKSMIQDPVAGAEQPQPEAQPTLTPL